MINAFINQIKHLFPIKRGVWTTINWNDITIYGIINIIINFFLKIRRC